MNVQQAHKFIDNDDFFSLPEEEIARFLLVLTGKGTTNQILKGGLIERVKNPPRPKKRPKTDA